MRDMLEQHIRDNKAEFDIYEPDKQLWEKIDRSLHPKRSLLRRVCNMAAGVIIVFSAGWGFAQYDNGVIFAADKPSQMAIEENAESVKESIAPELTKMESYYISIIDEQKSKLEVYHEAGIQLEEETFASDLDELQHIYKNLQEELVYGEDKEAVVDAMMQNLITQLNILKEQVRILENIKKVRKTYEKHI